MNWTLMPFKNHALNFTTRVVVIVIHTKKKYEPFKTLISDCNEHGNANGLCCTYHVRKQNNSIKTN